MQIELPEFSLILLVGPGAAGKTTFAGKHFLPTQILSSDLFRGMVCDDENEQSVTKDAFEFFIMRRRSGWLTGGQRSLMPPICREMTAKEC